MTPDAVARIVLDELRVVRDEAAKVWVKHHEGSTDPTRSAAWQSEHRAAMYAVADVIGVLDAAIREWRQQV